MINNKKYLIEPQQLSLNGFEALTVCEMSRLQIEVRRSIFVQTITTRQQRDLALTIARAVTSLVSDLDP